MSCTCLAALAHDPVCQHRSLVWEHQGTLSLDEPEPDPPAVAPVPLGREPCRQCGGTGTAIDWATRQQIACVKCRGGSVYRRTPIAA